MTSTSHASAVNPAHVDPPIESGESKRLARTAGLLYLLVGLLGGFAQGFVYPKIFAEGDAATTAGNLVDSSGLVRAAIVADLVQATLWVFVAMALYRLLHHVSKNVAGAMVVLAAIGAGITMLNAVFELEGLRVATGAVKVAAAGSDAQVLLLVDTHHFGLVIAQIFFGLWLLPMGYLIFRSGWFPKAIGVLLGIGGGCYLVNTLTALLTPDLGRHIHGFLGIPSGVAEIWTVLYLLVVGVKRRVP
jgi:Domain of unknown function (DUF4386)